MTQLDSLLAFVTSAQAASETVRSEFLSLVQSGSYLRDHHVPRHFCVYFCAVDIEKQKILLGFHKKAQLWIPSGGHLDANESIEEGLFREVQEEWGLSVPHTALLEDHRIDITPIANERQPHCSAHYNLWNFLAVDSNSFLPNPEFWKTEFTQLDWFTFEEARNIVSDPTTLDTIERLNKK